MIGVVKDFENLTLTSFPTIFEPLDLISSEFLLLLVNLYVNFSWPFSKNNTILLIVCRKNNN